MRKSFLYTWTKEKIDGLADELIEWIKDEKNMWLGEFAVQHGFSRERMTELARENEKFREAFRIAKSYQESRLVIGGLTKKYDSSFTKFVLHNVSTLKDEETKQSTTNIVNVQLIDVDAKVIQDNKEQRSNENDIIEGQARALITEQN